MLGTLVPDSKFKAYTLRVHFFPGYTVAPENRTILQSRVTYVNTCFVGAMPVHVENRTRPHESYFCPNSSSRVPSLHMPDH